MMETRPDMVHEVVLDDGVVVLVDAETFNTWLLVELGRIQVSVRDGGR